MNDREVMLIGGKFHRQKHRIKGGQYEIRVALPTDPMRYTNYMANEKLMEINVKYLTYKYHPIIVGNESLDNIFFLESINPMEWMLNLIKDYIR